MSRRLWDGCNKFQCYLYIIGISLCEAYVFPKWSLPRIEVYTIVMSKVFFLLTRSLICQSPSTWLQIAESVLKLLSSCRSDRCLCKTKDLRLWPTVQLVALPQRAGHWGLSILHLWLWDSHQQTFLQHFIPDQRSWRCRSILRTCIAILWFISRWRTRFASALHITYKSHIHSCKVKE